MVPIMHGNVDFFFYVLEVQGKVAIGSSFSGGERAPLWACAECGYQLQDEKFSLKAAETFASREHNRQLEKAIADFQPVSDEEFSRLQGRHFLKSIIRRHYTSGTKELLITLNDLTIDLHRIAANGERQVMVIRDMAWTEDDSSEDDDLIDTEVIGPVVIDTCEGIDSGDKRESLLEMAQESFCDLVNYVSHPVYLDCENNPSGDCLSVRVDQTVLNFSLLLVEESDFEFNSEFPVIRICRI